MLHYQTIDTPTLELLKQLQKIPEFSNLRLAGGTSLALQIGHRKSVDLDLFGTLDADDLAISKSLSKIGPLTLLKKSENITIYLINGIKVDIVNYSYPWLEKAVVKDTIVLADEKDISAMKLAAITGRGSKKDFIDLYFLLQKFNLKELIGFYNQKYADGSEFVVLKSLSYFDDADTEPEPFMLKKINWDNVKLFITSALRHFFDITNL